MRSGPDCTHASTSRRIFQTSPPSTLRGLAAVAESEAVEEEGVVVGPEANLLIERLADSVTARFHPEQDRLVRRGRGLDPGRHLLRVPGIDAWVQLPGREQDRRVGRAIVHVVVG